MLFEGGRAGREELDGLFDSLADPHRRSVLGVVHERSPDPVTPRDVATSLVPGYREAPLDEETGGKLQRALLDLHHRHLPKLEAAGLIERERNAIELVDHPAYADDGIVGVLGDASDAASESLDALFGALADGRRRAILDVLSHQFGPIHVETLARELGAEELDVRESDVPDDAVEEQLVALRHLDLPQLAGAGLIEYDTDAGLVDYRGHRELRVPWMHSVLGPDFRPSLTGESEPQEIGTIRGRENVISFGQSLCDRVDEELFCMFTDTDLLEAGCLTRIRDASRERGVSVYLGTPNPAVREYVREHAPEVVLWEPPTNWLNLPVAGNRVGRLLLADREAVMLGTLDEERDEDGFHVEKAIIGEGEANTLVVMVTQVLGPYFDRIDQGTEDLETILPF